MVLGVVVVEKGGRLQVKVTATAEAAAAAAVGWQRLTTPA